MEKFRVLDKINSSMSDSDIDQDINLFLADNMHRGWVKSWDDGILIKIRAFTVNKKLKKAND